jgi:hypothetical protein
MALCVVYLLKRNSEAGASGMSDLDWSLYAFTNAPAVEAGLLKDPAIASEKAAAAALILEPESVLKVRRSNPQTAAADALAAWTILHPREALWEARKDPVFLEKEPQAEQHIQP